MADNNTSSFVIDEVGDVSSRQYAGMFTVKVRLSHNDRFRADAFRRSLLGVDPNQASLDAQMMAKALSEISARLVDGPQWWKDSANGTELQDFNIINSIYTKALEIENKAIEEVQAKAKAAKEGLDKPVIKE